MPRPHRPVPLTQGRQRAPQAGLAKRHNPNMALDARTTATVHRRLGAVMQVNMAASMRTCPAPVFRTFSASRLTLRAATHTPGLEDEHVRAANEAAFAKGGPRSSQEWNLPRARNMERNIHARLTLVAAISGASQEEHSGPHGVRRLRAAALVEEGGVEYSTRSHGDNALVVGGLDAGTVSKQSHRRMPWDEGEHQEEEEIAPDLEVKQATMRKHVHGGQGVGNKQCLRWFSPSCRRC